MLWVLRRNVFWRLNKVNWSYDETTEERMSAREELHESMCGSCCGNYARGECESVNRVIDNYAYELKATPPELSPEERQFLSFALDQAAEEITLRDGFTEDDQTALEKFRGWVGER